MPNPTVVALCLCVAWTTQATAPLAPKKAGPSLAVLDFRVASIPKVVVQNLKTRDEIDITVETSVLTDKLIAAVVKTGRFEVMEREQLAKVVRELKLSESAAADPKSGPSFGKLLGADYLLLGTVSLLEETFHEEEIPYTKETTQTFEVRLDVDCRLVASETGRILAAEHVEEKTAVNGDSVRGSTDHSWGSLREQTYLKVADRITSRVIDSVFPIRVAAVNAEVIYINRGRGSGISVGDVLTVFEQGDAVTDPDTGASLGQVETEVAALKITEILEGMSKASVVEWKRSEKQIRVGSTCRRPTTAGK